MSVAAARVASTAFVGLGANLGEPAVAIRQALDALAALPGTRVVRASSLYRSAPVDASGPDFFNAVVRIETTLEPQALLAELHRIEREQARERPYRNAPRTLDLDLLLYDERTADTPALQLPHPRMHLRRFVLQPLAEIAPHARVPGRPPLAELLLACADQRVEPIEASEPADPIESRPPARSRELSR
jgi:2-amino-4-hydroxy-6-hydroxymethyldihydropteridine diphosphokinase